MSKGRVSSRGRGRGRSVGKQQAPGKSEGDMTPQEAKAEKKRSFDTSFPSEEEKFLEEQDESASPVKKQSKTNKGGKGAGGASSAIIQKADKAASKILTADDLWQGKHRERQISAITAACQQACSKLHGLGDTDATELANSINSQCADMECQYYAFSRIKHDAGAAVSALEDPDYDCLAKCDVALIFSIVSFVASELLKAYEKDEDSRTATLTQLFALCSTSEVHPGGRKLSVNILLKEGAGQTSAASLQHQVTMMLLEKTFRMKNATERLMERLIQLCQFVLLWLRPFAVSCDTELIRYILYSLLTPDSLLFFTTTYY